jgi:hypothetical protein
LQHRPLVEMLEERGGGAGLGRGGFRHLVRKVNSVEPVSASLDSISSSS